MARRDSLRGRAGILLFDQPAFLAVLLDDRQVGLAPDELVVVLLVPGNHDEPPRMRPNVLVVAATKQQNLGAVLVLALAEEGRQPLAKLELLGLLFEALVGVAEGCLVLRGLFYRTAHGQGVSLAVVRETTVSRRADRKAAEDGCRSRTASPER